MLSRFVSFHFMYTMFSLSNCNWSIDQMIRKLLLSLTQILMRNPNRTSGISNSALNSQSIANVNNLIGIFVFSF